MTRDYSAAAFAAARDPAQSAELAHQLGDDIARFLEPAIRPRMQQVIDALNALGHHLTDYGQHDPFTLAFRDTGPDGQSEPGLRVAHDSVVSTGFGDFTAG